MPLPYADDALAPAISGETMQTHHGKHHKAYVDKTNEAAAKMGLGDAPLEEIIAAAKAKGEKAAFNNAAQAWNHGFYWHSLAPQGGEPKGALAEAIERDFGSLAALSEELRKRGEQHFASGWVWLASANGKLSVEETHDGDTLALGEIKPLLTIDVWEHAYYIDRKNERPKYLEAVVGGLLNWEFAAVNLAAQGTWEYPG
ncbi:superoxide dismutase [Novosphingobium sp. Gsoil 351]|uniref:superoxide dismutase n=1 Tax=Novosphingobium sp. Gsoil 351 TaxID=2675225 RepID=UPI00351B8808